MQFIFKLFRFWVILVFLGLSGYFAIYNQGHISVSLPPWIPHLSIPAYLGFMASFLLGATVVLFFFGFEHFKKSLEIRRLKRRVQDLSAGAETGIAHAQTSPSPEATRPSTTVASNEGPSVN